MSEITNKELASWLRNLHSLKKAVMAFDYWPELEIAAERLAAMPDHIPDAGKMIDKELIKRAYKAGFIAACKWPSPVTQDVDSKAFDAEMQLWWQQQSAEGVE